MIASSLDSQGLYTFPNPLSKVPVGALLQADNLVNGKDGILESRRGIHKVGTQISGSPIRQFFSYQNVLIINDSASGEILYDTSLNQTWVAYPGIYTAPTPANLGVPNWRMRGIEANKNFYIATGSGVQKLDTYSGPLTLSGIPTGLDGSGVLAGAGSGFLGSNFQCAYQIVFGKIDVNGNFLLGSPSQRILVVNSTAGADNVTLTFTVPQGLDTTYFYQIYRTPQTAYSAVPASNVPPGAEPQLSTQQQLTAGQVTSLFVVYTDITPDELLGAFLYTNPSQEGSFQTNDRPPLCKDMCLFSQMIFYANCSTLQSLIFNVISVGAPNGVQVGDTITINGIIFTAALIQNNVARQFAIVTSGTVATNIDDTARNLVACINANASTTNVYALYISGFNSLPGQIQLQAVNFSLSEFAVTASNGAAFSPIIPAAGTSFVSSNDTVPNGIYVSKVGEPEAVPAVNLVFIGGGDQPILRVLPLRDRVVVLKTDGVYVITGSTPQNLTITLLDSTIICTAIESAKLLNNSVYCMSNQGVVSITESGITIQSRAIQQDLLELTSSLFTYFPSSCNAISYESENLYILAMPEDAPGYAATQAFCYNWITNSWTRWPIDIESGIINPYDNVLYVARTQFSPFYVSKERKTYTYADFKDDVVAVTVTAVDSTGLIVTISSTPLSAWVGYALSQTDIGTAIITAIDATAKTITLDIDNSTNPGKALGFTAGAAEIQVPIPLGLTLCPQTAGFPHFFKAWGRINFWFNSGNFNQILSSVQTDITGFASPTQKLYSASSSNFGFGPYGSGPSGGTFNYPQAIQTLPNATDNAMARWIMPSLSLSFPGASLAYLGTTMSYEIISDVAG